MQDVLYPVGRLVGGSLYNPKASTNRDGTPKLGKDGKPMFSFNFGVAYPKGATTHWAQTEWGAKIWAEGHSGFPNGEAQHPSFAWKVTDGDSTIPNKKGNKPAEQEGYPGHWVVWFSGTYAPKTCNANGSQTYGPADGELIKAGHYVQVFGSVKDNKPSESPGVYLNFAMVAHSGFGKEIVGAGVDATKVGFGGALPAGASATPLGQMAAPGAPATPPAVPGAPAVPTAAPVTPSNAAAPVTPIAPNPAFLNPPPVAAVGVPVAMPPAAAPVPAMPSAPVRGMTAKAAGHSYEAMRGAGWSDEQLIAQGYMTA